MTAPVLDLAAFINARLDEDEAAAREIHEAQVCSGCSDGWEAGFDPDRCDCGYPARVLREVQVMRRVVAGLSILAGLSLGLGPETARGLLRVIAEIWSDHPDYRTWLPVAVSELPGREHGRPRRHRAP